MNSHSSKALVLIILVIQLLHLIDGLSMCVSDPYDSDSLRSLEGLSKGQAHQAIPHLKHYISRFGRLNYMDKSRFDDNYYDEVLESAVKHFQRFSSLEVTGMLDSSTIKLMTSPDCPNIDIDPVPLQTIIG